MVDQDILQRFGEVWPRHVSALMQFLLECRRHFDGDLDMFLLMVIIGDRTFSTRHVRPDLDYLQWNTMGVADVPPEDINIQSIAEFSAIPRETVRRKLKELAARGWVRRDERGYFAATSKAKQDLEPLTLTSLKYLSVMKAVLNESLKA